MKFKRPAQTADSACLHPSIVVFVVFVPGAPNGAPCLQLNKNYLWCNLTRAKRVFLHPSLQKKKKKKKNEKGRHAYVRVASIDRKNLSQNITDENSLAIWQSKKKEENCDLVQDPDCKIFNLDAFFRSYFGWQNAKAENEDRFSTDSQLENWSIWPTRS